MIPVIDRLKQRARILQQLASAADPRAATELRVLPEFASPKREASSATRAQCLSAIARQLGFQGWPHTESVLAGARLVDMGTLLAPPSGSAFTNIWVSSYEEASELHRKAGGYLLGFRRQYFLASAEYVRHLGLDPDDPDWSRIQRDWPNAPDAPARARLYGQLAALRLPVLESRAEGMR